MRDSLTTVLAVDVYAAIIAILCACIDMVNDSVWNNLVVSISVKATGVVALATTLACCALAIILSCFKNSKTH